MMVFAGTGPVESFNPYVATLSIFFAGTGNGFEVTIQVQLSSSLMARNVK